MLYEQLKQNDEVLAYIKKGNANLRVLGYTDHSIAHCTLVAERAAAVLSQLGLDAHTIELAKIAGLLHDIGNALNRKNHAEYGALLAKDLLAATPLSTEDRITVMSAIAHHDESTGGATDAVSAALIIADKTDVRRNRVLEKDFSAFDIHDRVNYAVTGNSLCVETDPRKITLYLDIDEAICTMYEYFDIFLQRMLLSRGAAEMLGAKFSLRVNNSRVL